MEVIFSAVIGELASRSISFLVDRYLKRMAAPTEEERLRSLQRLLLRVRVVVEEADGRLITNQAMMHQLGILKEEMYRGYYTLDMLSCQAHGEDRTKDHEVSYSFAPSKFNPAKRVCFCGGSDRQGPAQAELMEQVLGSVRDTIEDASEFVMFLNRCPRLHRQPYNTYLLLSKCMFGRQMEMEHVMNFLLLQADAAGNPGVMPIIGPGKVGKSTLIKHACDDERVRNHFSQILCFNGDGLEDASLEALIDGGCKIKHRNRGMGDGRTLIIIELLADIDDHAWRRLYSAARSRVASGSKIIVASRSNKIARFGTTQPLRLHFFTPEAYWYFFKARTFGSERAEDHPRLAAIAMDMAKVMNGCFMGASIFSGLLRANFNPRFWSMALASLRNLMRTNVSLYGERFVDPWHMAEPVYVRRAEEGSSECVVMIANYEACSAETEPGPEEPETMMSVQDLFLGSVRPRGRFKVRAWTSHLPPHYTYTLHCEVQRQQRLVAGNM